MGLLQDLGFIAATSVVENKLEGERQRNAPKENWFIRFVVTIIWLVLSIGIDVFAVFSKGYLIGAIAEIIFCIVTFCVPYLRKKGSYTRWFGILALGQAAWLIYLMTQN